jgi:hypothetical protein
MGRRTRCHARPSADPLDLELARRLNGWLAGLDAQADHMKTLRSVYLEALYWSLAAAAGVIAAVAWIV